MGFFARPQKMVAGADNRNTSIVGSLDILRPVFGGGAVYLYLILARLRINSGFCLSPHDV